MKVIDVIQKGKSPDGKITSGVAVFNDGKEWSFIPLHDSYAFIIDSGIPSQESVLNYQRVISPAKRVSALKKWMENSGM